MLFHIWQSKHFYSLPEWNIWWVLNLWNVELCVCVSKCVQWFIRFENVALKIQNPTNYQNAYSIVDHIQDKYLFGLLYWKVVMCILCDSVQSKLNHMVSNAILQTDLIVTTVIFIRYSHTFIRPKTLSLKYYTFSQHALEKWRVFQKQKKTKRKKTTNDLKKWHEKKKGSCTHCKCGLF